MITISAPPTPYYYVCSNVGDDDDDDDDNEMPCVCMYVFCSSDDTKSDDDDDHSCGTTSARQHWRHGQGLDGRPVTRVNIRSWAKSYRVTQKYRRQMLPTFVADTNKTSETFVAFADISPDRRPIFIDGRPITASIIRSATPICLARSECLTGRRQYFVAISDIFL